jgi:hypothetical protein
MELSEELRKVVRSVLMEKKQSDQNESSGWLPWSARTLKIPFRSSEKTGSGPGEDRLAAEWGGQTMGQSTSYDVVVNGQKWEDNRKKRMVCKTIIKERRIKNI